MYTAYIFVTTDGFHDVQSTLVRLVEPLPQHIILQLQQQAAAVDFGAIRPSIDWHTAPACPTTQMGVTHSAHLSFPHTELPLSGYEPA